LAAPHLSSAPLAPGPRPGLAPSRGGEGADHLVDLWEGSEKAQGEVAAPERSLEPVGHLGGVLEVDVVLAWRAAGGGDRWRGRRRRGGKTCSRRSANLGSSGVIWGHLGSSPPSGKTCSRASAMLSANQRGCSERQIGSYLKAISRSSRGHLGCSERQIGSYLKAISRSSSRGRLGCSERQIGSSSKDTKVRQRGGGRECESRARVLGSPRGECKGCEHG